MSVSPERGGFERFVPGYKRRQERESRVEAARAERREREQRATKSLKSGVESAIAQAGTNPDRYEGCAAKDWEHKTRSGKVLYTRRSITLTKELPNGDTLILQKWGDPGPAGSIAEHGKHYAAVLTQSPDSHPELAKPYQVGVVDTAETSRSVAATELAESLPDLVAGSHFIEQGSE